MAKQSWIDRARAEPAAAAALAIFVISAATLAGAWYFQLVVGLPPCPLCLEERIPYHVVIPLSLLMAIAALVRAPQKLLMVGFVAIIVAVVMQCRARRLSRRRRMALVGGPDRLHRAADRSARRRLAAQPATIDPCRALRRGGVALSRHFARRLQRLDLASAGGDRGLRPVRAQAAR